MTGEHGNDHTRLKHLLDLWRSGSIKDSGEQYDQLMSLLNDPANAETVNRLLDEAFANSGQDVRRLTAGEDRQVLNSILQRIRTAQPVHETRILKQILETRTEQRAKVVSLYWRTAAAAAILILCTTGLWLLTGDHSSFVTRNSSVSNSVSIQTHFTGKQYLHLPDGSTVALNAGGNLSYSFTDTARVITLVGEAYFDVAHNPNKPFCVKTGDVITKVLGTAFNINYDPERSRKVVVTVVRGKVQVGNHEKGYEVLLPDEQITVSTANDTLTKTLSVVEASVATAWKDQFLLLENVSMAEAMDMIAKRYNKTINFSRPSLKTCIVNAKFLEGEDVETILSIVTATWNMNHKINEDGTITIDGIGCD